MASRSDLQTLLESLLGSKNVYYQPPNSVTMKYPAIRFNIKRKDGEYADDIRYLNFNCYEITVIDKRPDNEVIDKILELPMSSHDRHYESNNLNHDALTLYF